MEYVRTILKLLNMTLEEVQWLTRKPPVTRIHDEKVMHCVYSGEPRRQSWIVDAQENDYILTRGHPIRDEQVI